MIILKVIKKQGVTLSPEDAFLEKMVKLLEHELKKLLHFAAS